MQHFRTGNTWFLAQFKPNCHKIAERNLRRQDFQTFLPLHEKTKRKAGRFTTTLRPLFTGYLFMAFDASKGGWRAVNSTYGITRLVNFGGDPQPVPLDLISRRPSRSGLRWQGWNLAIWATSSQLVRVFRSGG